MARHGQQKGVQRGQVKGCEVRPLPPLAKPSFWYAFAHAFVSELGRCNGTHSVPVRRISLECNVSCQCRHEMADRSELRERAEAPEQLTAAAGRKRPTVADEVKMHSYTKRGCVPNGLCADWLCASRCCSAMYKKNIGTRWMPPVALGWGHIQQTAAGGQWKWIHGAGRRSRPTSRPTE